MDIIQIFIERHASLRSELDMLEAPFKQPHGVGWDDCLVLDKSRLLRDIHDFFATYKVHEAQEDEFLFEVSGSVALDSETQAAFAEGRRSLGEIMKLFSVVAFSCDGEHVHRVRELLFRLRMELEAHLVYEEQVLFPMLRETLPAELLEDLGRRAREGELSAQGKL